MEQRIRLPADQGPGPDGRGRHDALRRALPGLQLLRHRRGGDARRALVPLGDRTTRQARGSALGPGVSSPADHAASGGRRPVGGDRGKPDRHAGRSGLRGAHALRAADLVAAGHRHAVSHAARFLAKPGDRIGQRPVDGPGGDLACRPAAWAGSRRGGCWRERARKAEGGRRKAEERKRDSVNRVPLVLHLSSFPPSPSAFLLLLLALVPPPSSCS